MILADSRLDVNACTVKGTLLHQALKNCEADALRKILQHPCIDVNTVNARGESAIFGISNASVRNELYWEVCMDILLGDQRVMLSFRNPHGKTIKDAKNCHSK